MDYLLFLFFMQQIERLLLKFKWLTSIHILTLCLKSEFCITHDGLHKKSCNIGENIDVAVMTRLTGQTRSNFLASSEQKHILISLLLWFFEMNDSSKSGFLVFFMNVYLALAFLVAHHISFKYLPIKWTINYKMKRHFNCDNLKVNIIDCNARSGETDVNPITRF